MIKISNLYKRTGCPVETIRYYERSGLLPEPKRTAGNYRIYDERHVERLLFIRHCRYLDMTLDEIRRLLRFCDAPHESCVEVNDLLDGHIVHVGERIAELKQLEKQLRELRRACVKTRTAKDCGILQELANMNMPGKIAGDRRNRVQGTHANAGKGKN